MYRAGCQTSISFVESNCFTVGYLIENGIISSDSEKEEYIVNDKDNVKYEDDEAYVFVYYDIDDFKLKAQFKEGKVEDANEEFKCAPEKKY